MYFVVVGYRIMQACILRFQGSQAKKPYNPIIGEHFHCSWKFPAAARSRSRSPESSKGSECEGSADDADDEKNTRLYYCAEQVSHHPPVSAFYFESVDQQMYMEASLWTKSKFLGMSIGVVMIGKGE